jgi:hypothetical protein
VRLTDEAARLLTELVAAESGPPADAIGSYLKTARRGAFI